MTDYGGRLRLAFQLLDENPDTWGSIQNSGDFQLLEDAIAGSVDIDVTLSNQDLDASRVDGATDDARYAVLNIIGTPGQARSVFVPEGTDGGGTAPVVDTTKLYFVVDSTTGGDTITVITPSGTGVAIPSGLAIWVYCDGTNVIDASYAVNAGAAATAALATDSSALGTFAAALYPRLAIENTYTNAQVALRVALTDAASIAIDTSTSNKFFLEQLQNFTLANPTGSIDGKTISIVFKQGAGGPYTITFGTAWAFAGGVHPTLSTTIGDYDILSAEYEADSATWIGGMLKDVRNS